MAVERKKPSKSETLTIRMDPKMRFALEFLARLRGQSITTVVERAVKQAADNMRFSGENDDHRNWLTYWDVNEGIRTINLALDQETNPSFEEDEKLDFVKIHWPFFSNTADLRSLRRESFDILWPEIDNLLEHWRHHKAASRLQTGFAMQTVLKEAAANFVPAWPQPSAPPRPELRDKAVSEDDDIPF